MKAKIKKMNDQELINLINKKTSTYILEFVTPMESDYGNMLTNILSCISRSLNKAIIARGYESNNDKGIETVFQLYMMDDETLIYIKAVENFDTCSTTFDIVVEGNERYYNEILIIAETILQEVF